MQSIYFPFPLNEVARLLETLILWRSNHQRCSMKNKEFLKILRNSQENTCVRVSFLIRLQAEVCNFIEKDTLAQVFSREFCEICKNTFLQNTSRRLLLFVRNMSKKFSEKILHYGKCIRASTNKFNLSKLRMVLSANNIDF